MRAIDGNVVETVAVYVRGASPFELEERIAAFVAGLHQLQYRFRLTIGNMREEWTCQYSDFTVEADQPLRFATMALVRAQVPRLPTLTRELVP